MLFFFLFFFFFIFHFLFIYLFIFLPVCVWNICPQNLESSPSRIFEMSLGLKNERENRNTTVIFRHVLGKTIITWCSDLILHKIQVKYQKILDFEEGYLYSTSSQSRYRTCLIYTIFDIFGQQCMNMTRSRYALIPR